MDGKRWIIAYPGLGPIVVQCLKFRQVLPAGETETGGFREETLLQFWSDHGMRTVNKRSLKPYSRAAMTAAIPSAEQMSKASRELSNPEFDDEDDE